MLPGADAQAAGRSWSAPGATEGRHRVRSGRHPPLPRPLGARGSRAQERHRGEHRRAAGGSPPQAQAAHHARALAEGRPPEQRRHRERDLSPRGTDKNCGVSPGGQARHHHQRQELGAPLGGETRRVLPHEVRDQVRWPIGLVPPARTGVQRRAGAVRRGRALQDPQQDPRQARVSLGQWDLPGPTRHER